MTPEEIHELKQLMDALAREYGATHDPKILAELKELADRLRELSTAMQPYREYFIESNWLASSV